MKKLVLILLLFLSSQSFAEWEYVTETAQFKFFVDVDNMRIRDGYIYFWTLDTSPTPREVAGKVYQSGQTYSKADCESFRIMNIQSIFYSQPNEIVYRLEHSGESWLYPPPNSSGYSILKRVCE